MCRSRDNYNSRSSFHTAGFIRVKAWKEPADKYTGCGCGGNCGGNKCGDKCRCQPDKPEKKEN